MPPSGKPLSVSDVQTLKQWIAAGAKWEKHWAFVPPKKVASPAVNNSSWPRNEIDYFILSRLEREGLPSSLEADRFALLRRVSLDLTGLPPTQVFGAEGNAPLDSQSA